MKPGEGSATHVRDSTRGRNPRRLVQGSLPAETVCPWVDGVSRAGGGCREVRCLWRGYVPAPALGEPPRAACCDLAPNGLGLFLHFSEKLPSQSDAVERTQALGSGQPGLNPGFSTHHLCDPGLLIKCPARGGGESR